jgi:xanthine dehydrogenase accessory factor
VTTETSPSNIYRKLVELIDSGTDLAAAVVLAVRGSTPQVPGARAIVASSGRLWGTIGGGALEAKTQQAAAEACRTQCPRVFEFQLTNRDAGNEGAVCGGQMRVLLDPTAARHRTCFELAGKAVADRRRGCLLTTIRAEPANEGSEGAHPKTEVSVEWLAEESLAGQANLTLGIKIRSALESGVPELLDPPQSPAGEPSGIEVFIEPIVPQPVLLIAGAGHVGSAVALAACRLGFDVTIIDDRPEFASAELFPPEVRVLCGPVPEQIAAFPLDAGAFVVLATRGHLHDSAALAVCVRRPLAYLGMIGSQRKVALVRKSFLERGLATEEEFDRVHAPIGLPIGAVTVPEIAVSIMAQLIAVRRKANCR